LFDIKKQGVT